MIVTAIPYWESDPGKRGVLSRCLSSIKGQQDDIFVLAGKQKTLPTAWNMCLDMSFGMGADFVILSNDDIELTGGDFKDLCVPGEVVSPLVNGEVYKVFHAHIFALPRDVWKKVGAFDENFQVYWADTDYAVRLKKAGVPVYINETVNVLHPEPARTLKHESKITRDEEYFVEKWGRTYFDPAVEL